MYDNTPPTDSEGTDNNTALLSVGRYAAELGAQLYLRLRGWADVGLGRPVCSRIAARASTHGGETNTPGGETNTGDGTG